MSEVCSECGHPSNRHVNGLCWHPPDKFGNSNPLYCDCGEKNKNWWNETQWHPSGPRDNFRDRFLRKVQKTENCWRWIGAKNQLGYGHMADQNHRDVGAHRLAYTLFIRPIPEGMDVLHKCDNPGCVNPDHLFLGTQRDNIQDASAKGRIHHKLSREQVQEIKQSYKWRSPEFNSFALARRYGVKQSSIWRILHPESENRDISRKPGQKG